MLSVIDSGMPFLDASKLPSDVVEILSSMNGAKGDAIAEQQDKQKP